MSCRNYQIALLPGNLLGPRDELEHAEVAKRLAAARGLVMGFEEEAEGEREQEEQEAGELEQR